MSGECEEQEEAETDIADIVRVHAVSPPVPRSYKVSFGDKQDSELDTGASVSLVSEATWADRPLLQPCTLSLQRGFTKFTRFERVTSSHYNIFNPSRWGCLSVVL